MMAVFVVRAVVFACQTHYERQDHIFSKGCGGHVLRMQRACLALPALAEKRAPHQQYINLSTSSKGFRHFERVDESRRTHHQSALSDRQHHHTYIRLTTSHDDSPTPPRLSTTTCDVTRRVDDDDVVTAVTVTVTCHHHQPESHESVSRVTTHDSRLTTHDSRFCSTLLRWIPIRRNPVLFCWLVVP
jgi:hypothetical protein